MRQSCLFLSGRRPSRLPVRNGLLAMAASQAATAVLLRDCKTRKPNFIARPFLVFAEWLRARTSKIWSGRGMFAGHT